MAYCPQCGSEYREGFTRCNLCDRPLVEQLPEDFEEPTIPKLKLGSLLNKREPLSRDEVEKRLKYLAWVVLFLLAFLWFRGLLYGIVFNASTFAQYAESPLSLLDQLVGWLFVAPGIFSIYLILAFILAGVFDVVHRRKIVTVLACITTGVFVMQVMGLVAIAIQGILEGRVQAMPALVPFSIGTIQYGLLTLAVGIAAYYALASLKGTSGERPANGRE